MIVAATNSGASLDIALFRRFDDVIQYVIPDEPQVELLLRNSLAMLAPSSLDYARMARHGHGLSHSDIVRACEDAMKDAVLDQETQVSEISVIRHLEERASNQRQLL